MPTLNQLLRVFTWMTIFGCVAALSGVAMFFLPGGGSGIAAALVAAGGGAAIVGGRTRQRAKRMLRDKAEGKAMLGGQISGRDLARHWRFLAVANTAAGLLVSVFAIVVMSRLWAAVVVLMMALAVWETWRFERVVRRRR